MKVKKVIVFKPSYIYISNQRVFPIMEKISDFNRIYLNARDPVGSPNNEFHSEKFKKEVSRYFDYYVELNLDSALHFKGLLYKILAVLSWFVSRNLILDLIRFKIQQNLLIKYIEGIHPSAIITCSDMSFTDQVLAKWCNQNQVPFIILQPEVIIKRSAAYKFGFFWKFKYIFWNHIYRTPRYIRQIVLGNEMPDTYLFLWSKFYLINKNREKIYTIGNPALDPLLQKYSNARRIKNRVLIFTELLQNIFGEKALQKFTEIYRTAIKKKPEIVFYIKEHPRDNPADRWTKTFPSEKYPNVKIVKNIDLLSLFRMCDVAIAAYSQALLEAIGFGLPIITINPNNEYETYSYLWEEISIQIKNGEDLVRAIDTALTEKYWEVYLQKRELFLQKHNVSSDGKSGQRAAEMIRKIIEETSK